MGPDPHDYRDKYNLDNSKKKDNGWIWAVLGTVLVLLVITAVKLGIFPP